MLEFIDGGVLEGEFADGWPEGPGVFTDVNGDIYTGNFSKGKPDGMFTRETPDGETEQQVWKQGERAQ